MSLRILSLVPKSSFVKPQLLRAAVHNRSAIASIRLPKFRLRVTNDRSTRLGLPNLAARVPSQRSFTTQPEQGDAQEFSLLTALKTSQNLYEKDISKWEELSTLLIKVGMFYESLQKEEKAEEYFRKAVQLYEEHSPSSAAAHVILGNTLSRIDKLEEARSVFGQAVQKLESRAAALSSASSSALNINPAGTGGVGLVQEAGGHVHKHDPNHDLRLGLVHAYDGLIKAQMRLEGVPSAIPLIRQKLIPALKQLDAPQRVEVLHEWLKISLAAQREIVELQTVPGIGDFAIATDLSSLLLSSLEELQHSHGVLLDVLMDRATIEFSQHRYEQSLKTVERAMDVWRTHVRSSASEDIQRSVDMQLTVMLARRYHALFLDVASAKLKSETERLAQLNQLQRTYESLKPELQAAVARGEEVVPPRARPQQVRVLQEGEQMPVEEGREIADVDTTGQSQYESAISFYRKLERSLATQPQPPLTDLYITALVGLYHIVVEREWFFTGEKTPAAKELLEQLRMFDARRVATPDPLTISAYFISESVRFHSTGDREKFSLRLALIPRRAGNVYLEMTSPDYPNVILYKSAVTLKPKELLVIELKDLNLVRPDVPQLKEFRIDIFDSRSKAKKLALHTEFVVPTIDHASSTTNVSEDQ